MRNFSSPSAGKSLIRLCGAVLLASVATGCSSDVSRFNGLFSSSDDITTSSIPGNVPRGDVSSGQLASSSGSGGGSYGQAFPNSGQSASYDPMSTASTPVSSARAASTPVSVQRTALAEPAPAAPRQPQAPAARQVQPALATAEPLPSAPKTASNKGGWTTNNAPTIMVRPGDTVAALARRFGVPEKEILKANGLKSANQVEPGQRLIVPTFGGASSAAKAAASGSIADFEGGKRQPPPLPAGQREVAILPGQSQSRDKSESRSDVAAGKLNNAGAGDGSDGAYTVKPGDSLNKIAKANGVSVAALKQANGLTAEGIRVGQKLKMPGAAATATDAVVAASVPAKGETKVASLDQGKPAEYKPPVAKESVSDVAIRSDVDQESPKSTGISKYRWPVRGAVVAGYGANVDGNRNDGINISVPEGTPIKAAENGVVIYSGSSLKELGNAVLVRHDDGTVTVYGNASQLKVQRGEKVQRGQTLAASGMTGKASQPQVHFEVRKNATPVNPATFLE
ncbi:murein DD-endopeptidase MepM/ murein hydrolase activator NlpD [Sinorhizobium fredii]|uniref:Putative lipoprotein YgeR n=1 Tax=Sinorhizobium fredii (strain USDA 257) TaxID=1185652 RepID=I3X8C8_SINF2|nr:LysM peptidoglycan-binding domain-containing protein [Sinorhizobium fredii]AFL52134.1 putative lipoprotein YgeR [Sinorhizobium fredii USDA 257]